MCGLRKKLEDSLFLDFVGKYDIIFLQETFITIENYEFVCKRLINFKLSFQYAVRSSDLGRPSGGVVVGINKRSQFVDSICYVQIHNLTVFKILESNRNSYMYILPIYLNFNIWENDFESLNKIICSKADNNMIIIGDLNGRISDEQNIPELNEFCSCPEINSCRKSKDNVLNARENIFWKCARILAL